MPAASYDKARQLQHNAQHWTNNYLPALLNQSLDELNSNNEFLFIDKIEIEISEFPWQLSDTDWKEKITKHILQHRFSTLPAAVIIKQWIFYLKKGAFEKTAIIKSVKEIETFFLRNNVVFSNEEINDVLEIFSSMNVVKRMFFIHSSEFVQYFLAIIFKTNKTEIEKIYKVILNQLHQNPQKIYLILQQLIQTTQQNKQQTKEIIEFIAKQSNIIEIEEFITKLKIDKPQNINKKAHESPDLYLDCKNAGLVLLLPFITRFFENINVIKNNIFIDDVSKSKALLALHFLATGQNIDEEQDLLLPKILCGFEPNDYIEIKDELEESVKQETNELLHSIIEYWTILQNTSLEGLRETFLKRDGRLLEDANYILQVSNSGVDILLDKIPWGFRNYKLPWMSKTIITEWH